MKPEFKRMDFNMESVEEVNNIGKFAGHLAAFSEDQIGDIFVKGVFEKSITDHSERKGRPIRMLFQHKSDEIIGGFPIEKAKEDQKGLYVEGEINLEVQKGREAFALMKQGVLTDMSIGFMINRNGAEVKGDKRYIKDIRILEGSLVGEPMNQDAQVTSVKKLQLEDVEDLTVRDIESLLKDSGFSKNAVKCMISKLSGVANNAELVTIKSEMSAISEMLRAKRREAGQ